MTINYLKRPLKFYLFIILFLSGILSFAQNSTQVSGPFIKAEAIGVYDQTKLNNVVNEELKVFLTGSPMPFENFEGKFAAAKNSLKLFKITYQTRIPERGNKPTIATGLVAIPDVIKEGMPIVSYQHGTVFGHDQVPSQPEKSMETKLMLTQFGGQGYIVIGADYIGLGDSKEPNSYFCLGSTVQACMDMYKATMQFLKQQKIKAGPFFTFGWSQGGYSNMVFLRQLEASGIPVMASATASAPVDPNFFITRGLTNPRPFDAAYTAAGFSNLIFAYSHYYSMPELPAHIIKPEYLSISRDFYQFKIDWFTFLKKTTPAVTDFVRPEFIAEMKKGNGRFASILNSVQGYRWLSVTPLRAYTGGLDEAVPDYLAKFAAEYQTALGKKNASVISAGENADHRNTYIFGLIDVKPWFDSFLK